MKYMRIDYVAAYCETDCRQHVPIWLRYKSFRGRLSEVGVHASEAESTEFINAHPDTRSHLLAI